MATSLKCAVGLPIIILFGHLATALPSAPRQLYAEKDKITNKFKFVAKDTGHAVAWATYTNEMNSTGWSYLEVYTSNASVDLDQAYAAGLVEGRLTAEMITLHWHNTFDGYCTAPYNKYCKTLSDYLLENFQWMENQIKANNGKDAFWHQASLFLAQINGMIDGFKNTPQRPGYKIAEPMNMMIMFQVAGDLEDLKSAFNKTDKSDPALGNGRCSGLIKLLPNHKELFVAQDTWSGYQNFLRILKKYDFQYHSTGDKDSSVIPGSVSTFSSYPGIIYSQDDLYLISSGLVTLETTIGNGNASLWTNIKPTNSVLEGVRNVVANRLAVRGQDWVDVFSKYNSGTYNNQWMIVDYKSFSPGVMPTNGLLYVLEQIPGMIVSADKTDELVKTGYWASYNVAAFPAIFNASGQQKRKKYRLRLCVDTTA